MANETTPTPPFVFSCTTTVDAGEDLTACSTGSIVTLSALITGNYFALEWTPAAGLANAQNATTTATINATTTYTVSVMSYNTDNLIFNGDFSQGDMGFTSDYIYGTGGPVGLLTSEGQYAIDDNPGDTHNQFVDCNDHSPGTGNMMVVNASGEPDNLWCQEISVTSNTDYDFSAWVTSVVSQNPAQLQFSINGGLLGEVFNASSSTCNWTQFSAQWNSNNNTTAQICIVNVNSTPSGNDFALDDITFREICEVTDEITVTLATLDANFLAPTEFCENEAAIDPNTWLDAGATSGGTWTLDGNSFTTFDPSSVTQGLHQIVYTVSEGTCSTSESQLITINTAPNAGTPSSGPSLCSGTSQSFSLSNLLNGADSGGIWTEISVVPSTGGAFDAIAAIFNTDGQAAGTYQFQYSLSSSGCPDAISVVEVNILASPIADAGEDANINCEISSATLGGSTTPTGLDFQYTWTAPDGNPTQTDTPFLETDQEGIYTLEVTNTTNGCANSDEVEVTLSITNINAQAGISPLSCANDNDGAITIESASGGLEPYLYAIDGGPFMTTPTFNNLGAGQYLVTVMDANGCDTTLNISLEPPYEFSAILGHDLTTDPPTITLGEIVNLDLLLNIPLEKIDSIQWTPEIPDCPGCPNVSIVPFETETYQVTVTDVNGCTASAELTIFVQKNYRIFAPNAISPNEDGINDIFYINAGAEAEEIQQFKILDRWGNLIFERSAILPNDPTVGWDGRVKGKLVNSGVYVFFAEILMKDGVIVLEKGALNVIY
ncbi:MAG: hypothetical protein DHS20C18_08620 [Saprospiraceae bacterium]|nr:MAG: hypothetical protein DHS20C18_08620 [Saprospiraceae bacterium]